MLESKAERVPSGASLGWVAVLDRGCLREIKT